MGERTNFNPQEDGAAAAAGMGAPSAQETGHQVAAAYPHRKLTVGVVAVVSMGWTTSQLLRFSASFFNIRISLPFICFFNHSCI